MLECYEYSMPPIFHFHFGCTPHEVVDHIMYKRLRAFLSCRRLRQAEQYNWAATRGVNAEMLMENVPEDLQRDIRRHLFKFIKKVGTRISMAYD